MALLMALVGCYYNPLDLPLIDEVPIVPNDRCAVSQQVYVTNVVDGDTFDVASIIGELPTRIRLLGIDAPESTREPVDCWGAEASRELRRRIEGTSVLLTFDRECLDVFTDPANPTEGRGLAYVWDLDEAETSINLQLVEDGWASVYRPPDGADFGEILYQQEFDRAEQEAMAQGLGLWGNCP